MLFSQAEWQVFHRHCSPKGPRSTDEFFPKACDDFQVMFPIFDVSGHYEPASDGRNDPAAIICVSRHFSSKQARINSLMSGLFERKMPLVSSHLMQDPLAGSFRPLLAG